ncbi:MAG: glutamate racemase [Clostridia bacterium]|nr:glutamate racemase [Lachnospiraceae bacterium]NCB99584.1 glutamate racemase [Clostridia bacterium]NCD01788.1 glutamate racemase [Clostridia bacterium]
MQIDAPIGVFDSGVGGLTVVREMIRQLPSENIVYFGDTARVPYGTKSRDTIISYSEQIVNFLMTKQVKAIVVACNTATSYALDVLKEKIDIPIIGVVRPGALTAVNTTRNGKVGVIATEGTVGSGIYPEVIREYNPDIQVIQKACPLLVSFVEEGWTDDPVTDEVARRYLRSVQNSGVDTLVLGCTHFPLLRKAIGKLVGDQVTLVNPAYETARSLKELLIKEGIYRETGEPSYHFFVSDGADKFSRFANSILPVDLVPTRLVPIENY